MPAGFRLYFRELSCAFSSMSSAADSRKGCHYGLRVNKFVRISRADDIRLSTFALFTFTYYFERSETTPQSRLCRDSFPAWEPKGSAWFYAACAAAVRYRQKIELNCIFGAECKEVCSPQWSPPETVDVIGEATEVACRLTDVKKTRPISQREDG